MNLWDKIKSEAKYNLSNEPYLEDYFQKVIFTQVNLLCSIAEMQSFFQKKYILQAAFHML